jgi:regulator of extracellular matrix RemA (YlzA/DUF370 family)
MIDSYRTALDRRIAAGKVHLNDKGTLITACFERGAESVVIVDGEEYILKETDNLITNGWNKEN